MFLFFLRLAEVVSLLPFVVLLLCFGFAFADYGLGGGPSATTAESNDDPMPLVRGRRDAARAPRHGATFDFPRVRR